MAARPDITPTTKPKGRPPRKDKLKTPRQPPPRRPPTRRRKRTGDREQVWALQRARLATAMIDAIAEHGYPATRVADVVASAGVSRKTFYEHFSNKQDCLLSTYDLVADESLRRVESAYREQADGWEQRVQAAITALFEAAVENPGALRLSLLEITAVGPAGIARRDRTMERYASFIREALELAPGGGRLSDTNLRAIVGGLSRVLYRRVLGGDRDELLALIPELTAWATSYYPTPPALLEPSGRKARRRPAFKLEGGRAPGTLAPHARLTGRRGLPRGDQNVSRSFVVHSQRERILDAVANLTAKEGYASLKVEDIAEQAAVSLNSFYEHFEDKEDAFLVAFEVGQGKGLALVERAYTAEADWRQGVRAGIAALFRFLAAEPSFAHLALVDALVATSRSAKRSQISVRAFAQMLGPNIDRSEGQRSAPEVTIEAIAGGLFDLCLHYALEGRIRELPELADSATYVALAPILGSRQAAAIATKPAS